MTEKTKGALYSRPTVGISDAPLDATEIIDRYYDYRYRLYKDEYEGYYGK